MTTQQQQRSLKGKTLFITGASRGIGLAIALRAAREGANIVVAAKTEQPHPSLPGTIFTAAKEIDEAGGKALPVKCDIRSEDDIKRAVDTAVKHFGGIDILVNNASAIFLKGTLDTPMKRFDLMHSINARGTYAVSQACLPHLLESARKGRNPHILNISPPLNMDAKWFRSHTAYTMAKYGMSMCVLGMAAEFKDAGIAVNALWPRTTIATAAVQNMISAELIEMSRKPSIMGDAAYFILTSPSNECTGNFFVDDKVLEAVGIKDLSHYAVKPGRELAPDYFVEQHDGSGVGLKPPAEQTKAKL